MRRAASRFSAVSTVAVRPQATGSRASSSVSGKFALTKSMSCIAVSTVRCSPCQRRTRSNRSAEVLASTALNGSSSTITRASCSSSRANSMRWVWPPDSVEMARSSKPVSPTAAIACSTVLRDLRPMPPNIAGPAPQSHRHHVVEVDRERPVDLGGLRQIGDVLRPHAAELDAAGERLDRADDALEQGRLAGAVRADHRDQRTGIDRAVEMMHGRVPVVAQRQIAEFQRGGHVIPVRLRHGPADRAPQRRDQNRGDCQAFERRHAQNRRRDRGRRVAFAGMVMMG